MKIILSNLLSNAVEYTPPHVQIRLNILDRESEIKVGFINSTEDFETKDLPVLFQRFWRKDGVRGNTDHFGLGLSLAKTLSERLGITLIATLLKKDALCFSLTIPGYQIVTPESSLNKKL